MISCIPTHLPPPPSPPLTMVSAKPLLRPHLAKAIITHEAKHIHTKDSTSSCSTHLSPGTKCPIGDNCSGSYLTLRHVVCRNHVSWLSFCGMSSCLQGCRLGYGKGRRSRGWLFPFANDLVRCKNMFLRHFLVWVGESISLSLSLFPFCFDPLFFRHVRQVKGYYHD